MGAVVSILVREIKTVIGLEASMSTRKQKTLLGKF